MVALLFFGRGGRVLRQEGSDVSEAVLRCVAFCVLLTRDIDVVFFSQMTDNGG